MRNQILTDKIESLDRQSNKLLIFLLICLRLPRHAFKSNNLKSNYISLYFFSLYIGVCFIMIKLQCYFCIKVTIYKCLV